ncbi:hypothetical protein Glove_709g26 [Diversispora epigaea]|uniref:glutaminase n=1 Tax=Diversispora epigaea TaxID=1348612 RepID=A0A397G774_9GLOM|nr:hypothetical protein Glove_709g26 [Diversispora epigaea]
MNFIERPKQISVGVLALQGAFQEHIHMLQSIPKVSSILPVRTAEQLRSIDALIIPGGESTTIALVAEHSGIWENLKEFVRQKPTWGTCAGMILLANEANNTKKGGQKLLGGLDIKVNRNQFGSQIDSFESLLHIPQITSSPEDPFPAVFIRAPTISTINSLEVEILAKLGHNVDETDASTVVAVKQGHLLATSFHPELTNDNRIHKYFVEHAINYIVSGQNGKKEISLKDGNQNTQKPT